MPIVMDGVFVPVGREKVNWTEGPREAGLGHDLGAPSCVFARQGEGGPAHRGLVCGLRGRTAHKRERTKVLSLLRITLSPSGRASRVKALSRQTAVTHLLLQYEGEWLPPRRGAQCAPVPPTLL